MSSMRAGGGLQSERGGQAPALGAPRGSSARIAGAFAGKPARLGSKGDRERRRATVTAAGLHCLIHFHLMENSVSVASQIQPCSRQLSTCGPFEAQKVTEEATGSLSSRRAAPLQAFVPFSIATQQARHVRARAVQIAFIRLPRSPTGA